MSEKAKIAPDKGIELTINLLSEGKTRADILQQITTNYKISAGAVDKWIKAARPVVLARQQEAEQVRIKATAEAIEDSLKSGLKSDLEIEVILCQIITDNVQVEEWVYGNKILRGVSPGEIIAAAQTIFKKRGSNAPIKTAQTDVKGNDIVWNETKNYDTKHQADTGA